MTCYTRIVLSLMGELVAALRANDPDAFKRWLLGGEQDLVEQVVEELLLVWLDPFLAVEEQDRLVGWHLGGELQATRKMIKRIKLHWHLKIELR